MFIDLIDLYKNEVIDIDENLSFDKKDFADTELIDLFGVNVKGKIFKNSIDDYVLNIIVKGTMVLPCAVSLKPVNYDFSCEISENLDNLMVLGEKKSENNQKTIDILPIIWENILMEIPIRVVSDDLSDVKTEGDGWELISENEDRGNPSLAKLKDLL